MEETRAQAEALQFDLAYLNQSFQTMETPYGMIVSEWRFTIL